jgi:hypothetical protein
MRKTAKLDAFSKIKKTMKPKKQKLFMDKIKKNLSKVQPLKKK